MFYLFRNEGAYPGSCFKSIRKSARPLRKLGDRVTPINKSDAKLPDFDGTATDTIKRAIEYQVPDKLDKI
jgi:hypothetical protein